MYLSERLPLLRSADYRGCRDVHLVRGIGVGGSNEEDTRGAACCKRDADGPAATYSLGEAIEVADPGEHASGGLTLGHVPAVGGTVCRAPVSRAQLGAECIYDVGVKLGAGVAMQLCDRVGGVDRAAYGRSLVIAWNASQTAMMRAPTGISLPVRRSG